MHSLETIIARNAQKIPTPTPKRQVVIGVEGGISTVISCPEDVEVEIIDNDLPEEVYYVGVESEEYGAEKFGPYDTADKAVAAIARLKKSAQTLKDGVTREYTLIYGLDPDDE